MKFISFLVVLLCAQTSSAGTEYIECARWYEDASAAEFLSGFENTYLQKIYKFNLTDPDQVQVETGRFDANEGNFHLDETQSGEMRKAGSKFLFFFGPQQFIVELAVSPDSVSRYYGENWPADTRATVGIGYMKEDATVLYRCEQSL
jgi:hypothetical protein